MLSICLDMDFFTCSSLSEHVGMNCLYISITMTFYYIIQAGVHVFTSYPIPLHSYHFLEFPLIYCCQDIMQVDGTSKLGPITIKINMQQWEFTGMSLS